MENLLLLQEKLRPQLMMAEWMVQELIMNAFKDGNAMNSQKWVRITYGVREGVFVVYIADEGGGFHPYRIDNPCHPSWLGEENHGRGIVCVDQFTQRLGGATQYLPMAPGMMPNGLHLRTREVIFYIPLHGDPDILVSQFRNAYAGFRFEPESKVEEEAPK
jgi:hypothetical protein